MPGKNESGVSLIELCLEHDLVVGNSVFQKKDINKYTWARVSDGRMLDRALMDYVVVSRAVVSRLLDVNFF